MNSLLLTLSLLKLGIYAPAGAIGFEPYVAAGIHQQSGEHPLGLELGFAEEGRKRTFTNSLGWAGQRIVYRPTYMAGATIGLTPNDLDLAAGVRLVDSKFGPYVSISFRIGSAVQAAKLP